MRIVVATGTGTVGVPVVAEVQRRGHDVVVVARASGVDVLTGSGLDDALAGADAVIDVLGTFTLSGRASARFFTTTTQHLLDAERRLGVERHVALSIVGIDAQSGGYYGGKRTQERVLADSGRPYTLLRAAQFHELAGTMLHTAVVGPVVAVPRMVVAPVAAAEVAVRLVDLAEQPAAGPVRDLVGPERHLMLDLVRRYARAVGSSARVVGIRVPTPGWHRIASGVLAGGGDVDRGTLTFRDWLAAQDLPADA